MQDLISNCNINKMAQDTREMSSADSGDREYRVAIVTGAIRGIGLEIAKTLASCGIRCCLTYYDWLESLPAMEQAMRHYPADFMAVNVDLTADDGAQKVVEAAMEQFGRIDILINNIERGGWPAVHGRYVPEQWNLEFNTTVTAKWKLFRQALPFLKKQLGSSVVNISSIAGVVGRSGPASLVFNDCYSLANRAVSSMTEQWAREGAPEVRVNEVQLGFFDTRHGPGTRGWGVLTEQEREDILDHTLLGRTGRVEEAASAVRFLVLEAGFLTGSVLRLDGGYCLGGEKVGSMPEGVVAPDESTFGSAAG